MAKGIVARQRPLPCLCPEEAKLRPEIDFNYDHQSFFSGHTSSAFFAMTYLNKRVRGVMRSELSHHEYNNWRWVSSTVTFGWAGFVGWSRIQSYKHFPSDVAAGALAGWLLGELFFRFGNKSVELPGESTDAAMIIRLQFPL